LSFKIRRSRIAGRGAFASRRIRPGQRLVEYVGKRMTEKEADRLYGDDGANGRHHTFLFSVEGGMCIDASVGGNDARFINHSCEPNCEAIDEDGRIFIEAMKNIQPGTELTYDYQFPREAGDGPAEEAVYPCRCGSPKCRGTILEPRKKRKKRKSASTSARKRTKQDRRA
jgi:hypothetical protein